MSGLSPVSIHRKPQMPACRRKAQLIKQLIITAQLSKRCRGGRRAKARRGDQAELSDETIAPRLEDGWDESFAIASYERPCRMSVKKILAVFIGDEASGLSQEFESPWRDRFYRPVLIAEIVGLFIGIVFFKYISVKFPSMSDCARLVVGLCPFQVFAFGAAMVAMAGMLRRDGFRVSLDIPEEQPPLKEMLARNFRMLALFYPVTVALNAISMLLCKQMGIPNKSSLLMSAGNGAGPLYLAIAGISVIVAAPLTEEILVRLVCYRALRSVFPLWAALFSSLLFGVMHGNFSSVPGLTLLALGFQRAREQGGLLQAMLMHSMYNALAFLVIVAYSIMNGQQAALCLEFPAFLCP